MYNFTTERERERERKRKREWEGDRPPKNEGEIVTIWESVRRRVVKDTRRKKIF